MNRQTINKETLEQLRADLANLPRIDRPMSVSVALSELRPEIDALRTAGYSPEQV